jgi:hypothetical protein
LKYLQITACWQTPSTAWPGGQLGGGGGGAVWLVLQQFLLGLLPVFKNPSIYTLELKVRLSFISYHHLELFPNIKLKVKVVFFKNVKNI